jgi:excisionase family DNA binding protein
MTGTDIARPQADARSQLYTREDVARTKRISLRTVDRLIATGELPVVRLGRLVRIKPVDADRLFGAEQGP